MAATSMSNDINKNTAVTQKNNVITWGRIHDGRVGYPAPTHPVVMNTGRGAVFMSEG